MKAKTQLIKGVNIITLKYHNMSWYLYQYSTTLLFHQTDVSVEQ